MDKNKPTIAIYGIQDRKNYEFPFYVHDHNLAIMQNGVIKSFLQQERISRRKRDNTLHLHLKNILKNKKLLSQNFDIVFVDNVVGRSFLTTSGECRFEAPLHSKLSDNPERGRCWWFGQKKEAFAVNHELAHIFSCLPFFGNFKENSLLVHFDGGASLSNFSAATFIKGKIKWLEYHWDLKQLSTIYNANALVFSMLGSKLPEQNAVPGKFMGFAGWGKHDPKIEAWLLKNNLFQDIWGKTSVFFTKAKSEFGITINSFNQKDEFIQHVAATLQHIFIHQILHKLQELAKTTSAENLYYTGGSALNIVANTKIIESNIFKNVFIPPCTEDSGLALGAAAFAEWKKHGEIKKHSPYLNNWGIENYSCKYLPETIQETAEFLTKGKIIGICNGFGEAGPRALGNRSILALPDSIKLAKTISQTKKKREWYRPLAPVALEKNVRYFTGKKNIHPLSKYMLLDFQVLKHRQKEIEGVIHADGTARFQTIFNRKENSFLFDLLSELENNYKVKALINTSFNLQGEPIVHTSNDAINTARKMNLDAVIINGKFMPAPFDGNK